MISHLRGSVAAMTLSYAVIEVGGAGIRVLCAPNTLASLRVGTEAQIFSSLVVREDSLTLYGFASADERDMFELVQTASGVGPKVAQAMLAVLSPERLRAAVAHAELAVLTSVPGIGKKGAERIVLELKDRVGPAPGSPATASGAAWRDQVHEALIGLGWPARDADKAVETVAASLAPDARPEVSTLLRDALRTLSRA